MKFLCDFFVNCLIYKPLSVSVKQALVKYLRGFMALNMSVDKENTPFRNTSLQQANHKINVRTCLQYT